MAVPTKMILCAHSGRALHRAVAALLAGAALVAQPAIAKIYYVDPVGGSDSADGLSPASAWKSGPGDAASTGKPRSVILLPGDIVRFKGGVRYRGKMMPDARGTADNPVIFDGSSWGNSRAIIDGSDPVAGVRPCQSAADCFDNPNWRALYRIPVPANARWTDWIFANDVAMQAAQWPDAGKYDVDNLAKFLTVPRASLAALKAGTITHALPAGLSRGSPSLGLWVIPNYVAYTITPISVSASGVQFAGATWVNGSLNPYTDRDNKFTIMNAPDAVTRPGTFAMSPKDGYAILWPTGSRAPAVSIGARRQGINLGRASHLVIRGFSFTNFAGHKEDYGAGIAIYGHSAPKGIRIVGNSFRAVVNVANNAPALSLLRAENLLVEKNQFTDMPWTSAMQIDNTVGPVTVKCNKLSNITKTAIRFQNVMNGTMQGNQISGITGIHGNAITTYGDSRNVRILDNVVTASQRPMTASGVSTPYHQSGTPGIEVARNTMVGIRSDTAAITSYGLTNGLNMQNNLLVAPLYAISLRGNEPNVSASGNRMVGAIQIHSKAPLIDPKANLLFDPAGNGALLAENAAKAVVAPGVCS